MTNSEIIARLDAIIDRGARTTAAMRAQEEHSRLAERRALDLVLLLAVVVVMAVVILIGCVVA
jgi:hypothetical protein